MKPRSAISSSVSPSLLSAAQWSANSAAISEGVALVDCPAADLDPPPRGLSSWSANNAAPFGGLPIVGRSSLSGLIFEDPAIAIAGFALALFITRLATA